MFLPQRTQRDAEEGLYLGETAVAIVAMFLPQRTPAVAKAMAGKLRTQREAINWGKSSFCKSVVITTEITEDTEKTGERVDHPASNHCLDSLPVQCNDSLSVIAKSSWANVLS